MRLKDPGSEILKNELNRLVANKTSELYIEPGPLQFLDTSFFKEIEPTPEGAYESERGRVE